MNDRPVFYYDFNSPYAWLAAERVNAVLPVPPVWQPISFGHILQATDRRCVVYAGIDTVAFEGLCHGAHGWISALHSQEDLERTLRGYDAAFRALVAEGAFRS